MCDILSILVILSFFLVFCFVSVDGMTELVAQVSQLALDPDSSNLCSLGSQTSLGAGGGVHLPPIRKQKSSGGGFLPHIPSGHKPISLTARGFSQTDRGVCTLEGDTASLAAVQ